VTFYTLTFSISWGGMLLAIGGSGGLPGTPDQADRLMGIAFSPMAGPSVAGLLLTGLGQLLVQRRKFRTSPLGLLRDLVFLDPRDATDGLPGALIVSTTPMLVPAMTGMAFLTWFVVLAIALWVAVAAVAVVAPPPFMPGRHSSSARVAAPV
jgi:hypothetical protein